MKTGYTRGSGFCGAMFAKLGRNEVIVIVPGGSSTVKRNDQMMKQAELGFEKLSDY